MKLLGIIIVDFDVTDQLLIRFFALSDVGEKRKNNETIHQLFKDFRKTYDSVTNEVCTIFSLSTHETS
jgi:hypothetical protein